jgi:hypothetical protein
MRSELLIGLLVAVVLSVGAAVGFFAEQATQPSDLDLSSTYQAD